MVCISSVVWCTHCAVINCQIPLIGRKHITGSKHVGVQTAVVCLRAEQSEKMKDGWMDNMARNLRCSRIFYTRMMKSKINEIWYTDWDDWGSKFSKPSNDIHRSGQRKLSQKMRSTSGPASTKLHIPFANFQTSVKLELKRWCIVMTKNVSWKGVIFESDFHW